MFRSVCSSIFLKKLNSYRFYSSEICIILSCICNYVPQLSVSRDLYRGPTQVD